MSATPTTLKFRVKDSAMVPHHEREAAGVRSFIGRKYTEISPGVWGFAPVHEDVEVPYRTEYVKYCKDGDLHPANEATAKACGVKFDPTFGGDNAAPARTEETHVPPQGEKE